MRASMWLAAAGLLSAWAAFAAGDGSQDRVDQLIARLNSGAYRDREAATRELDALGADALAALRRAAASADPETRHRAAELVERIGDRLTSARILTPSTCEFKYENKPLADAVNDFARRTGATITLSPDPGKFRGRTITAATSGPIPFWDAVELFCRKAGLHEWDGFSHLENQPNTPQPASGVFMQLQGQVIVRRGVRTFVPTPTGIVLRDGSGTTLPCCRSGAVRVRIPPVGTPIDGLVAAADEVIVPLQFSAEAKLQCQGAVDVRIDRAVDDRGRSLVCAPAIRQASSDDDVIFMNINGAAMVSNTSQGGPVGVRVRRGDRPGTRLTELAGSIAARVRFAEPLAVVETPLKAVGQSVRGNAGVVVRVTAATRAKNGDVTVGVEVHLPLDVQLVQQGVGGIQMAGQMQVFPGGVVRQMRPGGEMSNLPARSTDFQGLALEDATGRRLAATRGILGNSRFGHDGAVFEITATFKPADAEQEPTRLVFTATRPATIEIPFAVKDIPLQ